MGSLVNWTLMSKLENIKIETFKTEKQIEKRLIRNHNRLSENCEPATKGVSLCERGIQEGEEGERNRSNNNRIPPN